MTDEFRFCDIHFSRFNRTENENWSFVYQEKQFLFVSLCDSCLRACVCDGTNGMRLNFSQYKWRKEGIVRYRDRVMQDKIQKREGNRRLKIAASFSTLASNLFDLFRFFSFPFCCFI